MPSIHLLSNHLLSNHLLSIRTLALAVLLACSMPAAFAQTVQPAIEKQMTPEQFKAAGLDKLSAQELVNLNAWLNHTIDTETTKAAASATQKIKTESRGFFDFGSQEPINGRIAGRFDGFGKGRTYTLEDGQVWQQIDDASLAGVRLSNPEVNIKPSMIGNTWYMAVGHYNTRAQVKRIK